MDGRSDPEYQVLKTKARISKLFDAVANSNWRRPGMRRVGDIPEIRRLRDCCNELERLEEVHND